MLLDKTAGASIPRSSLGIVQGPHVHAARERHQVLVYSFLETSSHVGDSSQQSRGCQGQLTAVTAELGFGEA